MYIEAKWTVYLFISYVFYYFITYFSGNVKNTRALKASVQRSYIIPVVAKHCDGLVSKPTTVNIQVNEMCSNGWKGNYIQKDFKSDVLYQHVVYELIKISLTAQAQNKASWGAHYLEFHNGWR